MDQRKSHECILKQTNGTMAMAVATPAGVVTGDQLAKIAELVKEGAGIAKFSTGQRIVILTAPEKVQSVKDGLAEVGLSVGPAGETVRNVKGCAGKLCKYANQDGLTDAITLDKAFAGREMPAALKIAVSGCPKNCMEAQSNDIGLIGLPKGYQVYVGGRGGRKQTLGIMIRDNVPAGELPAVVGEIIEKYRAAAGFRERISHVVEKKGIGVFKVNL
ncbi:MAG: hypothetical protein K6T80_04770 [Firmicutes bacterium]|nr:hypothetical protein [Bacillota bacterium]